MKELDHITFKELTLKHLNLFNLSILECDFKENSLSLEPVIQFKTEERTIFTNERR